jgi:dipeptidyl aminopeptidase/acylaminoacyl peptidase
MEGDRPMSRFCESDQPFLSGPWWKNWDAYMRTSPLYRAGAIETPLLLLHGTRDPGIKVSEAIACSTPCAG